MWDILFNQPCYIQDGLVKLIDIMGLHAWVCDITATNSTIWQARKGKLGKLKENYEKGNWRENIIKHTVNYYKACIYTN